MCDICEVQRETGLSDDNARKIIDAVQGRADDHYIHTILSILHTLETPNLKITREAAERAAEDMDARGITLGEEFADDMSSVTLSVRRPEDKHKRAETLQISDDNEIAQLFKALGLDF